jgi:hypothetical protein
MKVALIRQPDVPVRVYLRAEQLESRETPSATIRVDYTYDTSGFFNDPPRRAAIERVAAEISNRLQDSLAPIIPSPGNSWQIGFYNPLTRTATQIHNPTIRANEIVLYVAGGPLDGAELALASTGSWSATGSPAWLNTVRGRGQAGALASPPTDKSLWGGFIAFNSTKNWSFHPATPSRFEYDFASVAYHEVFHVLGFGLNDPVFSRWVQNGQFVGPAAMSVYGGPVPLESGPGHPYPDHWAPGTVVNGQQPIMLPSLSAGTQRMITALDWAALSDLGWQVSPTVPPPPLSPPPAAPPSQTGQTGRPVTTAPISSAGASVQFAVGSDAGTGATVAAVDSQGRYLWTAQPFPGFAGGVRVATADFTGDGVKDVVVGTGPGRPTQVVVFDGQTQAVLFATQPFEPSFTGGVYVAAGDLTGDGRAELIVTPDQGGGPRVQVYNGNGFGLLADFFGIQDPNFRGGARPAVGDLTGNGLGDLIVAAGVGGGPRVAGYRGESLRPNREPVKVFADFFAFEASLRNGVFIAAGDITGDGRADVVVGGGPGGGPRVTVFGGRALTEGRLTPLTNFFAGDGNSRGGVRVAVADLTGNGRAELITGSGEGSGSRLTAYRGDDLAPQRAGSTTFDFDFFPNFRGGIFVG